MKYKSFTIKIIKDEYVEGGKIYSVFHKNGLWVTNYPSLSLAKEFVNVLNELWLNNNYNWDETVAIAINRVG